MMVHRPEVKLGRLNLGVVGCLDDLCSYKPIIMAMKLLDIPQIKNAGVMGRLKMVEQLLESIGDLEITEDFEAELARRGAELVKKPKMARSWSAVRLARRK